MRADGVIVLEDGRLTAYGGDLPDGQAASLGLRLLGRDVTVSIAPEAKVAPAAELVKRDGQWSAPVLRPIAHGDATAVRRLIFTADVPLRGHLHGVDLDDETEQSQVTFSLVGWRVTLAEYGEGRHVVEAIRPGPVDAHPEAFMNSVFGLLCFASSTVVGLGPACGYDSAADPVWLHLAAPRKSFNSPPTRWLPVTMWNDVLPKIADGWSAVEADPQQGRFLRRMVATTMPAFGPEVLDVKVMVSCAALELAAWWVLPVVGLAADGKEVDRMEAGAAVREALTWAGAPTELPANLTALQSWRLSRGPKDDGPAVLFQVRNRLIHPPKQVGKDWPSGDELVEAWRLALEYTDLILLRILSYTGRRRSRLQLGGWHATVESVPWGPSAVEGLDEPDRTP